jgi:hypothetical protein
MVEPRLVKLRDCSVLPKVILVATDARALRAEEVESAFELNCLFDLNVTYQALCTADFLAALVTLGTV